MLLNICWADRLSFPVFDYAQWNKLIDWFWAHGNHVIASKTDLQDWCRRDSWQVGWDQSGNYTLYVGNSSQYHDWGPFFKFLFKSKNELSKSRPSGIHSINYFRGLFKERTGLSLYRAFGGVEKKDFRGFQYTPIMYCDPRFIGRTLHHFYKCDISAAYPYQGCSILPDAHQALKLTGRRDPTADRPFAFYLKSNQLAIYNELSTFEWLTHPLNTLFIDYDEFKKKMRAAYKADFENRFHYVPTSEQEDITLLMKASKYNFEPEFRSQYERRKTDEVAKQICNIAIGCLSSPNYKVNNIHQRHITSVIYARHMVRMMQYYDEILRRGGVPVSVVTDSISWLSRKNLEIGDREKKFGAFVREVEDTDACYKAQGVYAVLYADGTIRTWHQGYQPSERFLKSMKKVRDILKIENESIQWRFDRKTFKFVGYEGGIFSHGIHPQL